MVDAEVVGEAEARALAGAATVGRLAAANPGLGVDVVPMPFALLSGDDGVDQVVAVLDPASTPATRRRRLRNLAEHPAVTLLIEDDESAEDSGWWVRMRGRATVVAAGPLFDDAVAALSDRHEQLRRNPPQGPAIVVGIDDWSWGRSDR